MRTQRNVKRRRSGEMRLRWTAAGMLEAEQRFRRVEATASYPPSSPHSSVNSTFAVAQQTLNEA